MCNLITNVIVCHSAAEYLCFYKKDNMKAAVIFKKGALPQYTTFPEPEVQNEDQLILSVKAVAIKHLDKKRASGKHYSSSDKAEAATVIGGDGVGLLADGTRVFALGVTGTLAEKAVIEKKRMIKLPAGIDDASAAALPNAVAGSAMALRFRAGMKEGETVLINGATGFTGKMAVQVAKHYGAKKIIVTGRNEQTLQELLTLGADEIIPIQQEDEKFVSRLKEIHTVTPIDIILDYLWGHSAELILSSLKGNGAYTSKVRFISIGAMSGDKIQLSAEMIRSTDIQLSGSGLGSWSKAEIQQLFSEILPEMFDLAAADKLKIAIETVNLTDIEKVWDIDVPNGKRLVVTI
jgi:NADPH:quinone reductase-like Zn-dependent oxidoreductase